MRTATTQLDPSSRLLHIYAHESMESLYLDRGDAGVAGVVSGWGAMFGGDLRSLLARRRPMQSSRASSTVKPAGPNA